MTQPQPSKNPKRLVHGTAPAYQRMARNGEAKMAREEKQAERHERERRHREGQS